jgi:hypothetical protein
MTQKVYRTAQGKTVDIGALQLQNENVRAVGNMNINAQGDLIDGNNRPIDTRNQQVARQYRKQVSNVRDDNVYASNNAKNQAEAAQIKADIIPPEDFEDDFVKPSVSTPAELPSEGLAAAIARAKQAK